MSAPYDFGKNITSISYPKSLSRIDTLMVTDLPQLFLKLLEEINCEPAKKGHDVNACLTLTKSAMTLITR